jgi:hypothetical protein
MGCRSSAALCRDTLIAGANSTGYDLRVVPGVVSLGARFAGVKTCDFCGRQEADDAKTLAWSTAVEGGRAKTYCESCSRENLRAMEGKLDSEYW